MNNQKPTRRQLKAIALSLFLFLSLIAADTLRAEINIMPLGDSITYDNNIGDGRPDDIRTGYRQPLWLDLIGAGYDVDFVGSQEAGQSAVPPFDPDNEGYPGFRAEQIRDGIDGWLATAATDPDQGPVDVVLLHIGTNDISLSEQPADVAVEIGEILDNIDQYDGGNGANIWVILARIINRAPTTPPDPPNATEITNTTTLNTDIQSLADDRIANGDKLIVVNMETGAGLVYLEDKIAPFFNGDMWDELHPNTSGYDKMATAWFDDGLFEILPLADAGGDQNKTEGENVQLDGTFSNVPMVPNGNFMVLWEQTAGTPMVTISDPNILTPTFTAPDVGPSGIILRFRLSISDVDNANITDTDFVDVTVNDTPVGATVTVNDVSAIEGTDLSFTVTLDNAVASGFNVSVNFTNGTATGGAAPLAAPEDYADDTVTLNFAGTAGETQTFTVATLDDALDEGNETFTVSLVASNANVVDTDTAVGTIIDNDTNVINTVSNGAGGGGGGCFIQTVSGLFN